MIDQESLKKILKYHPETGEFTWLVAVGRVSYGSRAGKIAQGKHRIKISGVSHLSGKLAALYQLGIYPKKITFKDGDFTNIKWDNLLLD